MVPLQNRDGTPRHDTPRPVLARGKVRHVGQPVALVVAETLRAARDAAEAIEVDYEQLPAVTDAKDAIAPGAPQLFDHIPGNLVFDWDNDMGDASGDRRGLRQGRARRHARTRQQPRRRQFDGAAQRASPNTIAASGRSTLYTGDAGPAFRARSARRDGAQDRQGQAAPDHAQCRRRLRHEGLRLSRTCAGGLGEPQARTPGEVAGGPLRRIRLRQSGPRSSHARRACARCQGPLPRLAGLGPGQYRRLPFAVRQFRADTFDRPRVRPLCVRRHPRQCQRRLPPIPCRSAPIAAPAGRKPLI